jgi:surface polysaccharide O-acyltransferase-like enzyme
MRSAAAAASRLGSVEVMRVMAALAVIAIHAVPLGHATGRTVVGTTWDAATVVNQLARFAVPCFFVLSGVFWGRRTESPENRWPVTRSTVTRLLLLFVGWSLVYVFPWEGDRVVPDFPTRWWANVDTNIRWISRHPWQVLFAGTNGHLWFLMALAQATLIAALFRGRLQDRWLLVLGAALFLVYLLAKPYRGTPLGLALGFNPRNGPFVSTLFFVLGLRLARRDPTPRWLRYGGGLALLGVTLSMLELTWLHAHTRTTLAQDLVVGTIPFGVGMAMVALSGHRWLSHAALASLGTSVLGIYASHLIFLELLGPIALRLRSGWWDVATIGLVFGGSLAMTTLLGRWRGTRWLVR